MLVVRELYGSMLFLGCHLPLPSFLSETSIIINDNISKHLVICCYFSRVDINRDIKQCSWFLFCLFLICFTFLDAANLSILNNLINLIYSDFAPFYSLFAIFLIYLIKLILFNLILLFLSLYFLILLYFFLKNSKPMTLRLFVCCCFGLLAAEGCRLLVVFCL